MTGEGDAVECSSICSGTSLPNRSLICCESLHQLAMSNKSCNKQRAVLHDGEGIEAELGQGRILIAVFPLTGPAQREAFQHVYQSALGLLHLAVRLLYFVLASMNSERRERENVTALQGKTDLEVLREVKATELIGGSDEFLVLAELLRTQDCRLGHLVCRSLLAQDQIRYERGCKERR